VEIETWRIGATDYSVQFTPDDSGKLRKVSISPHKIKDSGGRALDPPVFDALNTLLVEKYGKPDSQTSSVQGQVQQRVHVWALPTTTIQLQSIGSTRFVMNLVTLTYTRKDKAALDAL
jgi:hypothetical protein